MSIASEITRLQGAKAALKTAIETKGVTVSSSAKLDDYAELVGSIQTGSGSESIEEKVAGYEGVEFGYAFNNTVLKAQLGLSPEVTIPSNCTSLTLCHKMNFPTTLVVAKEIGGSLYVTHNGSTNKTFNPSQSGYGGKVIRMNFNLAQIDACYIKDDTNGTYLWKGNNVT